MKYSCLVLCLIVVLVLGSCKPGVEHDGAGGARIRVVTTLFPLYDMAKSIGGDKADVSLLLPPGIEAHSFEPKPGDIVRINEADIFIYTGKFMEPWAEDVVRGAVNKKLIVVDASRGAKIIPAASHDGHEPAGSSDPHIWLDLENAEIMTGNIALAFEKRDGDCRSYYERRAEDYRGRLAKMDAAFRSSLADCKSREIVYAGHYAFGYLAGRYGLRYLAAQGVSPDSEPTARDLARLVDQIRKNGIRYVFYEELASPKIAETLAGETSAKLLILNAAHNLSKTQFESGASFFDILGSDLASLKTGLECKQ